MNTKRLLINIVKIGLLAAVIYFVYRQFAGSWDEVIAYDWTIDPILLTLSFLFHLLTFLLLSKVWCFIISALGHKVKLSHAFKISYIANLGRYIPGKIWSIFGMAYYARQLDINEEKAVASWALAMIFNIPPAFFAGGIALLLSPQLMTADFLTQIGVGVYLGAGLIFLLSLWLILLPNQAFGMANYLFRKLKRPEIDFSISAGTALKIYLGYFICWICFGFSFWLFISAISSESGIPLITSIGAFIIAYQVGYLALFAPGGVGVRELVLTAVLSPYIGPIAAGIAVAARIWNLIAEILAALIALSIKLKKRS